MKKANPIFENRTISLAFPDFLLFFPIGKTISAQESSVYASLDSSISRVLAGFSGYVLQLGLFLSDGRFLAYLLLIHLATIAAFLVDLSHHHLPNRPNHHLTYYLTILLQEV